MLFMFLMAGHEYKAQAKPNVLVSLGLLSGFLGATAPYSAAMGATTHTVTM
jgi:hypothetical protein